MSIVVLKESAEDYSNVRVQAFAKHYHDVEDGKVDCIYGDDEILKSSQLQYLVLILRRMDGQMSKHFSIFSFLRVYCNLIDFNEFQPGDDIE